MKSFPQRLWRCALIAPLCMASSALSAPGSFGATVATSAPFAHYRFDEGTRIAGATLTDSSLAGRNGSYQGSGATSATGAGIGSDAAANFTGGAAGAFASVAPSVLGEFGSSLGQSTYEFIFRTNTINPAEAMTLFGAFNRVDGTDPTGNVAVSVDLNVNSTGSTSAGSTRIFLRGADGVSVAGVISNPTLRDGLFHHLAFTYDDRNSGVGSLISAYVDGVPQLVTETNVNGTGVPTTYGNFEFAPSFAARQNRNASGALYDLRANITLDEAALYTVALSPADVAAHSLSILATGAAVPEPGSLAFIGFVVVTCRRGAARTGRSTLVQTVRAERL